MNNSSNADGNNPSKAINPFAVSAFGADNSDDYGNS